MLSGMLSRIFFGSYHYLYTMSTTQSGKTLLTETRDLMRRLHYSIHTERAYCDWIARFVRFHHMQARETLFVEPEKKVEDYLTYLAVQANVAAATQNQAFNALVFLYKRVLDRPLENVEATHSKLQAIQEEIHQRRVEDSPWAQRQYL